MTAPVRTWVHEPPSADEQAALVRLARVDGARAVAAMPDVHLAREVCVGTVLHTERWLYPAAIGGDVGCGVTALRTTAHADDLVARGARVLAGVQRWVPILTRGDPQPLPEGELSHPSLRRHAERTGRRQLGTIGRGNHFLELQRGEDGAVWVVVHSGSRSVGPTIQAHHRRMASHRSQGLEALAADGPDGVAYREDLAWTRRYARLNRELVVSAACTVLHAVLAAEPTDTWVDCDHNHVMPHPDGGWIHRKGALDAARGTAGFIPGSMGTPSFRTEGRGHAEALWSSSHGAGRRMSRTEARRRLSAADVLGGARDVVLDRSRADRFVEEAPAAYRDIGAVMRAQGDLVRIVERLDPLLNHRSP